MGGPGETNGAVAQLAGGKGAGEGLQQGRQAAQQQQQQQQQEGGLEFAGKGCRQDPPRRPCWMGVGEGGGGERGGEGRG